MDTHTHFVKRRISSQTIMAFMLLIFGMLVVMISLYLPPRGEIHASVLTVFGMVVVAAGAFMGIDLNFQLKHFAEIAAKKGNVSKNETDKP